MDLLLFFVVFVAVAVLGVRHYRKVQAKPGPGAPKRGKELPEETKK